MAADLIMPTLPGDQQQSRHFMPSRRPHHTRSQSYQVPMGHQISPINTDQLSNHAVSTPPSPTNGQLRQGRPLYMPAALRHNDEFPVRIITKSRTTDFGASSDSDSDITLRNTNSNFLSLAGLGALTKTLNRRPRSGSIQSFAGDWNVDSFPEVTGGPTRQHWKPDIESTICDDPTCKRNFSTFIRRHHCRKCGNIYCDWHSGYALPLDQDARFNPRANPSRICNFCFDEFKAWNNREHTRNTNAATSGVAQKMTAPISAAPGDVSGLPRSGDVAASVPRDWNWSTF